MLLPERLERALADHPHRKMVACSHLGSKPFPRWERAEVCEMPEGTAAQGSRRIRRTGWSRQPDLNRRPTVYETVALPTELCRPGRRLLLTARDFHRQAGERRRSPGNSGRTRT